MPKRREASPTDVTLGPGFDSFEARPGLLIRRLYQIYGGLFIEECARFGVTPIQSSVLRALAVRSPQDKTSIGHKAGIDRSTTTGVLRRLEKQGYLRMSLDPEDRRRSLVSITRKGMDLVQRMRDPIAHAHARLIEPLSPEETDVLVNLLLKLVEHGNDYSQTKLDVYYNLNILSHAGR